MNIHHKIFGFSIVLTVSLLVPGSVHAGLFENVRQESRQEFRREVKESREEKKDMFKQFKESISSKAGAVRGFLGFGRAVIGSGELVAKTDSTLTIKKDDKTYTVQISDTTKFRRRFWGKSEVSEFSIGNTVNVVGTWADESHTTINAILLRNISIQKRFGVFFGQVKSLLSNGWIMSSTSDKRPDQTVTVSGETKFVNRKGETITQAEVKAGHRVRVRGLWDNTANTVTEVKEVKDFSLPPFPSVTVTATATVTPTVAVTSTP